jgi:hypothetical protein
VWRPAGRIRRILNALRAGQATRDGGFWRSMQQERSDLFDGFGETEAFAGSVVELVDGRCPRRGLRVPRRATVLLAKGNVRRTSRDAYEERLRGRVQLVVINVQRRRSGAA